MKQIQLEELEILDNKLLDCLACLSEVDSHNLPSAIKSKYTSLYERIRKLDIEVASMYDDPYADLTEENNYGMDGKPITYELNGE